VTDAFKRGLMAQGLAYVSATIVAVVVLSLVDLGATWLDLALADVAATVIVFGFSVGLSNSSLYDPYWSVAPPLLGVGFVALEELSLTPRAMVALALTFVWGARLTYSFLRGWPGLSHEDWRYRDLRDETGPAYWLVSLLGIHLFPTALTFAGSLALFGAIATSAPLSIVDAIAALVTVTAIAIEARADRELRDFVRSKPAPDAILDTGLWAYSRHPNYLGEILFWWGLALFSVAAGAPLYWALPGAIAITLLFVFVSIPMIERRMAKRRPGWAAHRRRVPALVPWKLSSRSREARDRGASPPR
jgi:steroid 5-alpha reductase family enzyme